MWTRPITKVSFTQQEPNLCHSNSTNIHHHDLPYRYHHLSSFIRDLLSLLTQWICYRKKVPFGGRRLRILRQGSILPRTPQTHSPSSHREYWVAEMDTALELARRRRGPISHTAQGIVEADDFASTRWIMLFIRRRHKWLKRTVLCLWPWLLLLSLSLVVKEIRKSMLSVCHFNKELVIRFRY